jgi:hypothetical protein
MKDTITIQQAIVTTREQLLKAESALYDKIIYFKEATLNSLLSYIASDNSMFSTSFFAVETSEISVDLAEVKALRKQLELFESVS